MPFDPTLPVNNSPLDAGEMRNQLNGLFATAQARALEDDCVNRALGCARNPAAVAPLALTVSNPPTMTEVQQLADKVDELIAALQRP